MKILRNNYLAASRNFIGNYNGLFYTKWLTLSSDEHWNYINEKIKIL